MKNNKIPVMSEEERENAWKELKVGDSLVNIDWNYWRNGYDVRQYRIKKRTPKGWIRLDNNELLKEFNSNYYVVTDELKTWFEKEKLCDDIWTMINLDIPRDKRKFKNNLSYEDALKLKEIFERTLGDEGGNK